MKTARRKKTTQKYSGTVLIISMIFVMIFSALAVSFAAFSQANVQLAENHHKVIGATLDDGGSETTDVGDVGHIEVTPDENQMLPSGITSPIVIKPLFSTYSEG